VDLDPRAVATREEGLREPSVRVEGAILHQRPEQRDGILDAAAVRGTARGGVLRSRELLLRGGPLSLDLDQLALHHALRGEPLRQS
jgi:hypothetical protein